MWLGRLTPPCFNSHLSHPDPFSYFFCLSILLILQCLGWNPGLMSSKPTSPVFIYLFVYLFIYIYIYLLISVGAWTQRMFLLQRHSATWATTPNYEGFFILFFNTLTEIHESRKCDLGPVQCLTKPNPLLQTHYLWPCVFPQLSCTTVTKWGPIFLSFCSHFLQGDQEMSLSVSLFLSLSLCLSPPPVSLALTLQKTCFQSVESVMLS
jgi:hypothetical protein